MVWLVSDNLLAGETAVVMPEQLNVRGQASLNGEVATQLRRGEKVTVLEEIALANPRQGEPARWARIVMPTNTALWVHASFIHPGSKTVIPKQLNVRAGPGENHDIVGRLEQGAAVKAIRTKENWMQIENPPTAYGFVAAEFLRKTTEPKARAPGPMLAETNPVPAPVILTPPASAPLEIAAPAVQTLPTVEPAPIIESVPSKPIDTSASSLTNTVNTPAQKNSPSNNLAASLVLNEAFPATNVPLLLAKGRREPALQEAAARAKHQTNAVHRVAVPYFIDREEHGEIRVWVPATLGEVRVDADTVLKELAPLTTPQWLSGLKALADDQGTLSVRALIESGLEAAFNDQVLEFRVNIPPSLRRPTEIEIYGRRPPPGADQALRPSSHSAYLNVLTGLDYVEHSVAGGNEGRQPVRVDLEGAINFHNWVLEGAGSFTESADQPWQRGDVRLVRDAPEHRLRYAVGDLAYPVSGFQNFQPIGGFTVARNFSLQPYRVTEPLGHTSFFLKNPSKVEVFINGRPVQTLNLPAGPHSVRDFLFSNGGNDVVLRITDDVGRVETVQLSFFFDTRLLAQGEHEFAYSVGELSRVQSGRYHYASGTPAYTLFHRYGLSDTLTVGANLQGDGVMQMLGGETVWATKAGTFSSDLALSRMAGTGVDYAARLQYRYYDASLSNPWGSIWSLAGQYRGKSFVALGDSAAPGFDVLDLSARYSQRLPWQMNAGLGGSYQFRGGAAVDTSGLNLFLSKRWGRQVTTEVTLDRTRSLAGRLEDRAFISVNWLLPGPRQSVNASYDSLTGVSRADWQTSPPRNVGGWTGDVGAQSTTHDYQLFGSATYTGYRGEASFGQDVTTPTRGGQFDSRTQLRLGTALVYADGVFGLSRPVRDSFAMVTPQASLKGQSIGLEPIEGTYSAETGRFGPAVAADLQSYQVRRLVVEAPDLAPGQDLGQDIHILRPTYKSGTVIRVGTDATVIATGELETADGRKLELQAGELVSLDAPETAPRTAFTNKRGQLHIEGLKPGAYELRLFLDPRAIVRLVIPAGATGVYAVGTLKLPPEVKLE